MGWSKPKPPNTISDRQMADLRRRGQKVKENGLFTKKSIQRRLAANEQQKKSGWS